MRSQRLNPHSSLIPLSHCPSFVCAMISANVHHLTRRPAHGLPIHHSPRFGIRIVGRESHDAFVPAAVQYEEVDSAMSAEIAEWCDLTHEMVPASETWISPRIPDCRLIGLVHNVRVVISIMGVERSATIRTLWIFDYFITNVPFYAGREVLAILRAQVRFVRGRRPVLLTY